jgi:hypothetical protein
MVYQHKPHSTNTSIVTIALTSIVNLEAMFIVVSIKILAAR